MAESSFEVQLVGAGSPEHRSDLDQLAARGLPLTHQHASWPLHDPTPGSHWVRVNGPRQEFLTGFCLNLSPSGLLPWARIGRIDRLGRRMHASVAPFLGHVLAKVSTRIPRLLWLEAQLFDEEPERLAALRKSIMAAGAKPRARNRSYSTTLVLPLGSSADKFMATISARARRKIREFDRSPLCDIRPVSDRRYVDRMKALYAESFRRTDAAPPPFPVEAMLDDAEGSRTSLLLGAFCSSRQPPEDLVGFVWSRFHGDYVSYDIAASDRGDDLGSLAPGYALVRDLADWGRQQRARWMDLGGISKGRARANPSLRGIHEFKKAFWSEEAAVAAEFELCPGSMAASAGRALLRLTRGN